MMFSKEQSDSKRHSAFFDSFWKEVPGIISLCMIIRNTLDASCATAALSPISGFPVALRGSKWSWFTTPTPPIGQSSLHALT